MRQGFHPPDARVPSFDEGEDLRREENRVFRICADCRRCETLCPVFPEFFRAADAPGGLASLPEAEMERIAALCYQCTLCFQNCPYRPPHPSAVDVPHVLLRAALLRRREGEHGGERFRSNRELTGALGGLTAPWSNRALKSRWLRRLLESVAGVPRERLLPEYERLPFERWFHKREKRFRRTVPGGNGKAALFCTCMGNHHHTEIGRSAVAVLHHNDVEVALPQQRCCGLPFLEAGRRESAFENVRENTAPLVRLVGQGFTVVVPEAACSYMLAVESPWLVPEEAVSRTAAQTMDLCAYLLLLHRGGRLRTDFRHLTASVAYHYPARLRAQHAAVPSEEPPGDRNGPGILERMKGERSPVEELLGLVPGVRVRRIDLPSGLDGILGLSGSSYREAVPIVRRLAEEMLRDSPDLLVTECSQTALLLRQETGREVLHPITLLRLAYGLAEPA